MQSLSRPQPGLFQTIRHWWKISASYEGPYRATRRLVGVLWEFVRDSTPQRLRQRFGDADYDWDYRVNTTSGAVGWHDRLMGQFHSAYQPTEPAAFHEMFTRCSKRPTPQHPALNFRDFTFIDLGSGKGRTLLMASDYPFRRIIGVEFLQSLHEIAQQNLQQYKSESQQCFTVESICNDATAFRFPDESMVMFLFNPFPESGMRKVFANLEQSLHAHPGQFTCCTIIRYWSTSLTESGFLRKLNGTHQYSLLASY